MFWRCVLAAMACVAAGFVGSCATTGKGAWGDMRLPAGTRAEALVRRMTVPEKISQCMMASPAIPRLGVPAYHWWSEALHGIARNGTATVFPQAIGLAATFDTQQMHRVAEVISIEARAKHEEALRNDVHAIFTGLTLWSPNVNIFRDPRWGRGQETYGEDPFLTGQMGVAFVTGIQGDDPNYLRCVATPKHFAAHSGPEPLRHHFDAWVSQRDLHETYLPAFMACVEQGHAASVMAAYSSFNGVPCTGNPWLLTHTLRDEWGFDGAVVSDVDSVQDIYRDHKDAPDAAGASALAIKAGNDLCSGVTYKGLGDALKAGLIQESDIDRACVRLFTLRFRLGMFDGPEACKYQQIPASEIDSAAHDALALETAHKSMVLLKNDGVLPLNVASLKQVAVIGPVQNDLNTLIGNYHGTPARPVTILTGLRNKLEPRGAKVISAPGCPIVSGGFMDAVQPFAPGLLYTDNTRTVVGLRGDYYFNKDLDGAPAFTRVDANVQMKWDGEEHIVGVPAHDVSMRWTGVFVSPRTGPVELGTLADDGVRLWVDGRLMVNDWTNHAAHYAATTINMEQGKAYAIRLEYFQGNGGAEIRFGWKRQDGKTDLEDAVALAQESDVVVLALGITPMLEGEEMPVSEDGFSGGDRVTIGLPASQQKLLAKISECGKPVVVVLTCGSCISFDTGKANAALVQWYSGQRGGDAVADVLFGDFNPAGRLPVTFYKNDADLPPFSDYSMLGRTYRYFAGKPLYPFGYGLSYTTFAYGAGKEIGTVKAGEVMHVVVPVTNTGTRAGDEVVQVYARGVNTGVMMPLHWLVGFARVGIAPGETKEVKLDVPVERLRMWDVATKAYVVPVGEYELQIGGSSEDVRGRLKVEVAGGN